MRKINKGKEPREWTEYRTTPDAVYQSIPQLRASLLEEQGYVCAYCMRRIPVKEQNIDSKISHIQSRANHSGEELNYRNMVMSCPGKLNGGSHCDDSQHDADLTIQIFSDKLNSTVSYKRDGTICCSDTAWEKEMTAEKRGLNLNLPILKANRKAIMDEIQQQLMSNKGAWSPSEINKKLKIWSDKDSNGYKPYYGVAVWYLEKKLKQIYRS